MAFSHSSFDGMDIILVRSRTKELALQLADKEKQMLFIGEQSEGVLNIQSGMYDVHCQAYVSKGGKLSLQNIQAWQGRIYLEVFLEEPYSSVSIVQSVLVSDMNFTLKIYHKASFTHSKVATKYLIEGGKLAEYIQIIVPKISIHCTVDQSLDILQLSQSVVSLLPELKISSPTTQSQHAVSIHTIAEDQMFYLMSKGLSIEKSSLLIQQAFLNV